MKSIASRSALHGGFSSRFGKACAAAGLGFVIALALIRMFHPITLSRRPQRAFAESGGIALAAFCVSFLAASARGVSGIEPFEDETE